MIPAIAYLYTLATSYRLFTTATTVSAFVATGNITSSVDSYHGKIASANTEKLATVQDLAIDFTNLQPVPDEDVTVAINPSTLPDYMEVQSDLTKALIEQQRNTVSQLQYQNTLLVEKNKILGQKEAHAETIANALNSALPAIVIQLQEVSKIAGSLSLMSEINTAYEEQKLLNHEELITALGAIKLAPVTNVSAPAVTNNVAVPDQTTAINNLATASSAQTTELGKLTSATTAQQNALVAELRAMNLTAFYEAGVLNVTNVVEVPTVTVEAPAVTNNITVPDQTTAIDLLTTATTSQTTELSKITENLNAVSDLALVEKTIADYNITPIDIVNLDGNVVANMRPIEAITAKNITDAKNATDEMEFEIPDDIIDDVMGVLPIQSYTKISPAQDNIDILRDMGIGV